MTSIIGAPAPDDIFTDHQRWADVDAWNRGALDLHERGGIHRVAREGFAPIWAVIDHAAVLEVERQPALFTNEPEPVLIPTVEAENRQFELKTLIHVDDPLHAQLRGLTADWFKPSSVRRLDDHAGRWAARAHHDASALVGDLIGLKPRLLDGLVHRHMVPGGPAAVEAHGAPVHTVRRV